MSPVLAIDLGTKTGWAISGDAGTVASGTQKFSPRKGDAVGRRFHLFRKWLAEAHPEVSLVVYEDVRGHVATYAAQIYGGFEATLTGWCEARGIPYRGVHTGTLKKAITGKGNATKEEVMAAIRLRGFEPEDDNEADAIGLLLIGTGIVTPAQTGSTTRKGTMKTSTKGGV